MNWTLSIYLLECDILITLHLPFLFKFCGPPFSSLGDKGLHDTSNHLHHWFTNVLGSPGFFFFIILICYSLQMYQSYPGGQSSCSNQSSSSFVSATNDDSGVGGENLEDFSTLEQLPFMENLSFEDLSPGVLAIVLEVLKQRDTSQLLQHLKKKWLKPVRVLCWCVKKPNTLDLGLEISPVPATGENSSTFKKFVFKGGVH